MVSSFISRLVILVFGTLYPAYASYKAVRTKNVKEYVKWMMYWIVFALFTCAETFTDLFFSFWFPFYYEIKIITVIYLLSPATKGSSILYRKFVHPVLIKREQEIDEYIAKAKEQGYHTMLNLGSKGVTYATSLIMQTAIKGGGGLVNQLRRSYSLSDLNDEQCSRPKNRESSDDRDSPYDEDPGLIRRKFVQNSHGIPPAYQSGLYFSEIDYYHRSDKEDYKPIPSSEEVSSGYSSADPLYYSMQRPKGDHLVRTASLGPSRVRTRAATRNGLPKRASLSEEGSSWSALESHESQNETDMHFNFPLTHSNSLPFSFPSLQHIVIPDYQHMHRNWSQNQMFTFINNAQYSQLLLERTVNSENKLRGNKNGSSNNSIRISEKNSDNCGYQTDRKLEESNIPTENNFNGNVVINDEMKTEKCKSENFIEKKEDCNTVKREVENESKSKMNPNENESLEEKEKSYLERSGRYNKKPAPVPPLEEPGPKSLTIDGEEVAFFTPNTSPNPVRKVNSSNLNLSVDTNGIQSDIEAKPQENYLELPKKSKLKAKKDFMARKLHMPKMTFSFWHQKGGKQSSASESSSVASVDLSTKSDIKNDSEYFTPSKDSVDGNDKSGLHNK